MVNASIIPMAIGLGVILVVGVLGLVLTGNSTSDAEQRLDELSGKKAKVRTNAKAGGVDLLKPPSDEIAKSHQWLSQFFNAEALGKLYQQADVGIPFNTFLLIATVIACVGAGLAFVLHLPPYALPMAAGMMGAMPFVWLTMRRKKRISTFMTQMSDAMELVGRALRAGHGLASGLHVVAEEMPPPISQEFGRIYEEQNLGIPLDEALRGLAERIPTMDVRFFVTAVVIQRATGGDLAEVLDKIGRLIRERFQIHGHVRALTGEGRISGAVLLSMPPALMAFLYTTNPDYIGLLFTTEIGKKMLIITAGLQLLGAAAIKKIVAIKV